MIDVIDEEIIIDYVTTGYIISTDDKAFCVMDKYTNERYKYRHFIKHLSRIFPDSMKIQTIVGTWLAENINTINIKIHSVLNKHKVIPSNGRMAWVVVNGLGKELTIFDLQKQFQTILPPHFSGEFIKSTCEEWFDDSLLEANTKIFK